MTASANRHRGARLIVALLLLGSALLAGILPAAAQRPNGAGIVINFGDGSILYAYVQFDEGSITSEELLYRSGLAVVVAPYSGLGAGVCMIRDVGCPSDNCFCKSYTTPAYFWHFYGYDGGWVELLQGVSSRSVGDGDIDGFAWTAGDSGLPDVTIDEIAQLNGVDRNPSAPTPTETPTLAPTDTPPPPTSTPPPTATQPASTSTPNIAATATSPAVPTATATISATSTATAAIGQVAVTPSPTREAAPTRPPAAAPSPTLTLVASATTLAVIVQPDGTAVPVEVIQTDDGSSMTNLLLFGGLVVVAAGAGAVVWLRNRRVV
ncbi:MAG TPA: hypothetical protein VFV93_05445 [Thermomicrobiales bacterium]|nr:hypothetical protein [Thermomicrobiales bacterium]